MKSFKKITNKIIEYFKSFYENNEEDISLRDRDKRGEVMEDMNVNKEVFVEENNDEWSELEGSFTSQPKGFLNSNSLRASEKLDKHAIQRQLGLQDQLVAKSFDAADDLNEKVLKESSKTNVQKQIESQSQVAKSFKVTDYSYASNVDPSSYQANTQKVTRQVQSRGRGS